MSKQWYGSINNRILENAVIGQPELYIGMGVTNTGYTDRFPGTIIAIVNGIVTVQEDIAIRVDTNGMSESQSYLYVINPKGHLEYYRKGKDNRWQRVVRNPKTGRWVKVSGWGLYIGVREKYHDFSF